jgi:hypothetical protein
MATTTNFGWTTPNDTDLVKDGAAAIRTLGSSIDTTLVDLKGGTTGQVLAKNSNTDMDFVWSADASGIPVSAFTAKGVILVGTGTSTYQSQTVGTNGQVLTADSAEADGVKWATPSSPSFVGCVLFKTGAQSISNNTTTIVTFTSESIDTDGFHDNSTNTGRITIPTGKGGKYLITAAGRWGSQSGDKEFYLFKNGAELEIARCSSNLAGIQMMTYSVIVDLIATDYVELRVYQASGGSMNLSTSNFSATYLGA